MKNKEKAIIYCRVSTTKQGNNGNSLNNQEEVCRRYCKFNNILVSKVFKEEFTGKSSHRPEFNNAISTAIDSKINYFIVFDIDRFSREGYEVYSNFKNLLEDKGIKLRDSKNVIGDKKIVVENDKFDMSEYNWNKENPSEMAEMVHSAQAKLEGNKIIQRTIPKEILLEQNGYHPRASNYGFQLKKVMTGKFGKAKIQEKDPIEGDWVIEMFTERAKGLQNDKEIVEQVNLKGALKRKNARLTKDKPIDVKYMQELMKNPIYAGIKVAKWNNYIPIKQKYSGLVSINIWNKANRGKYKIIELDNGSIKILDSKNNVTEKPILKRRHKFNSSLPFRNLVKSDMVEGALISGSYSNPSRKTANGYYHTNRKKGVKGENIKKEEFEKNIYSLFEDIEIFEPFKKLFIDRFDYIFEKNKESLQKNKNSLIRNLKDIQKEKELQESSINNALNLPKVLERINTKLEELDHKESKLKQKIDNLENSNYLKNENFKKFCFGMFEHFEVLLKESQSFDELDIIFKFIFKDKPTYNQIVNRTPSVYPIFAIGNKKELSKIENSSVNLKWQVH